ncbi:hypothetical protein A3K34_04670 [candidate division WWE3 bacterium RIFOXYC1_FULL_40_10]|uniref:Uncharacterized protein n=1 Tax=candidate division WWE3 bacterium RIFOXYA2_FULL_46_9 TaxID=1802636 RepID=A0A1F4W1B9_UNCKA|nr:MAG: hypothetical protein A3K58_04670 [candidate division WWE3 bacterium RIFOXYB1_FULL_40_22]OGC62132.1 MAG: hypothetical protein A3K37_04670 [candidate division WWE3 bacterium RIFOXYA1_FULL_40_11]OGC63145.1 MAG: hypothetical protein A2264_00415 [candidate division WWE3 bacterium RIFOXYA2_FULL_46_9]OGC64925.1 MAG: hypothetical protein A2326_02695 [candidate division WWE3 bacterium RIFOXYB2_FULL_41_6]OGC66515.1 MAG: hypothetical protein A3K34_04670 [candidate division WWE3 bacterium RIFOXYC1_
MSDTLDKFKKSVQTLVSELEVKSPQAAKVIKEWIELLADETKSDQAEAKIKELPKMSELSYEAMDILAEIISQASMYQMSLSR